jgi:hypothetical protein
MIQMRNIGANHYFTQMSAKTRIIRKRAFFPPAVSLFETIVNNHLQSCFACAITKTPTKNFI